MTTKFVVPLPRDEYGNTGYVRPLPVIEVEEVNGPFGTDWNVVAPPSFKARYSALSPRAQPYAIVAGPARELNDQEYLQVLIDTGVDARYIARAKARIDPDE